LQGPPVLTHTAVELKERIGTEVHLSPWLTMTQERINAFAAATDDHQWLHVEPERACKESPYGCTIAHGYLTLSLYAALRGLADTGPSIYGSFRNSINYGLNRVRFPNPVRVNSRVRLRAELAGVEELSEGLQLTERFQIEIDGETKPACVAEVIFRLKD